MKSVLPERKTLHPLDIEHRELPAAAARAVRELADEISTTLARLPGPARHTTTLTDPALLELIDARAGELPDAVRHAVRPPEGDAGAAVLRRLPLTDAELGPTPANWRAAAPRGAAATRAVWQGLDQAGRPPVGEGGAGVLRRQPLTHGYLGPTRANGRAGARCAAADPHSASLRLDLAVLLLARCAGEPFGWVGQQDGRLVNNIVPSPGHEFEQSGASSATLLSPHTEDAFHPERANLLMLACLRNVDAVGTTVSSIRRVDLDPADRALLTTPTLPILPDVSYGDGHERHTAVPLPTIWDAAENTGAASFPTLRYDPAYTPLDDADPAFRLAYARLGAELERVCVTVALAPGEMLLVDNDVAVHGRVPFTARYDGTDRWLKRVNIRLPERRRRAAEADENGYGQRTVAPFRKRIGRAGAERETTPDERGRREHS
ncbi:TauD/TfdA family dioxygenase [Nocardia farcinica]|uniref:TauD/TfdA family dioxygenase n=1 Tax=Nocardia farcinica TaxID=37329 RepID=UPI002457D3CA|nr:TauD/TfdA family dioxygenase [Nocardia farcinica]